MRPGAVAVRAIHLPCQGCGADHVILAKLAEPKPSAVVVDEAVWASFREGLITAEDVERWSR